MKQPMSVSAPLRKPDGSRITAIRFETTTTYVYEHVDEDTPVEITEVVDGGLASRGVIDFLAIADRFALEHPDAALGLDRHYQHDALLEPPPPPEKQSVKVEITAPPGIGTGVFAGCCDRCARCIHRIACRRRLVRESRSQRRR